MEADDAVVEEVKEDDAPPSAGGGISGIAAGPKLAGIDANKPAMGATSPSEELPKHVCPIMVCWDRFACL